MPLLSAEVDRILAALEEARRKVGVKRFRNIRRIKRMIVKKGGKGVRMRKALKIKRALRKGPVHNRHR
jgi:hypothetical protein